MVQWECERDLQTQLNLLKDFRTCENLGKYIDPSKTLGYALGKVLRPSENMGKIVDPSGKLGCL